MTTFGGLTIPPIFGGGKDGIFIRGVGLEFENADNIGVPAQNIPAASANVGDLLVVIDTSHSGATAPIPPTLINWTNSFTSAGGSLDIWTRIATGDALDDYRVAAIPAAGSGLSVQYFKQMISLASGKSGMSVAFQNAGPNNVADNILFPITTMPVGADLFNNFVLGLYVHFYFQVTAQSSPTIQPLSGLETIGNHANDVSQPGFPAIRLRFFSGWSSVFQAAAASVAGSNIVYAPTRSGRNRTAFVRFHLV